MLYLQCQLKNDYNGDISLKYFLKENLLKVSNGIKQYAIGQDLMTFTINKEYSKSAIKAPRKSTKACPKLTKT